MSPVTGERDGVPLRVHGPVGVVDLVVPAAATVTDVSREYAAQARLPAPPPLTTVRGAPLAPDLTLADARLGSGSIVVAVVPGPPAAGPGRRRHGGPAPDDERTGLVATLCAGLAAAAALLAGWVAARLGDSDLRTAAIWTLGVAAGLAVLPVGRHLRLRAVAAPAFAFAAALAVAWHPAAERMPTVLGVAALTAAVTAAVARSLQPEAEEALRVWMVGGVAFFLVTIVGALAGVAPQVVWSVLLVAAMLAARFVPTLAVDVPDQFLIDLERLAVTAWSAREQPRPRRGRTVVPRTAVAAVAERGARTIVAASAAVLAVAAVSAPLLLATATLPVDRIGARCVVGFAGAALLLAARSYRNAAARTMLRLAGLACWVPLGWVLLGLADDGGRTGVVAVAVGLAVLLVVVAVAVGRGWRSAWWSRRAEVAEGVSGAFAFGAVVVAVGLFRRLWELTGQGLTP